MDVSDSLGKFAWDVFDVVGDRNAVFSPFGLFTALGMLASGSDDGSPERQEVLRVLHSDSLESLNRGLPSMAPRYEDAVFHSSNLMLVDSSLLEGGARIDESYLDTVSSVYGGSVSEADFRRDADAVREMISRWVKACTEGLIPDYESIVTDDTVMDLLNVVYFKAEWFSPFDPHRTSSCRFTSSDGSVSDVRMMSKTSRFTFGYHSDGKHRGVRIRYKSGAAMLLVLPESPGDLGVLESWRSETAEYRVKFMNSLLTSPGAYVSLAMPAFTLSADYDLRKVFEGLGMDAVLFGKPGFGRMIGGRRLAFDAGKHQAKVKVDEEGTEAAAVTEIAMALGCALETERPIRFCCDVPFVFAIVDEDTGAYLFAGYVGDGENL